MSDDFTTDLLTGVAQHLENAGVGAFTASGVPSTTNATITIGQLPQTPDQIICLTDYQVDDNVALSDAVIGVQLRIRGTTDYRVATRLRQLCFDALHGLTRVTLGSGNDMVQVVDIFRQSSAPLGPDSNGRHERSDNYYIRLNQPHTRLG